MPRIPFEELPDDARVWVFGASESISIDSGKALLSAVDGWLEEWTAHGEPLVCAREWREGRFLVIGVDQRTAGASGCSIDSLYRVLKGLETTLGNTLLGSDRIFYRAGAEAILTTDRRSFTALAAKGLVDGSTIVFDTAITDAGAYRNGFEKPAGSSWHRELLRPASGQGAPPQTHHR